MSSLTGIVRHVVGDLREKRLWPLALLLLAAVLAVPVLLGASSRTSTSVGSAAAPGGVPAPDVPAIQASKAPTSQRLTGSARNPFAQLEQAKNALAGNVATTAGQPAVGQPATGATHHAAGGGANGAARTGSGAGASPPTTRTPTATPTPTPPASTPALKAVPAVLTHTESYDVSYAYTTASGGVETIDPLQRLSVLPSPQNPLLVELGVLSGGGRVLFAVEPGATVSGSGTCIPGPIDCQLLSLGRDQTEAVARQTTSGALTPAIAFAITAITAAKHTSVAAADQARRQQSAAGGALLSHSSSGALALFPYDPGRGYVIDLRNLTVGGK